MASDIFNFYDQVDDVEVLVDSLQSTLESSIMLNQAACYDWTDSNSSFDNSTGVKSEIVRQLQDNLHSSMDQNCLKQLVALCVQHSMSSGNPQNMNALCHTSSLLGIGLDKVTDWYTQFTRDPKCFIRSYTPEPAGETIYQVGPPSPKGCGKRTWLLEDHPNLYEKAKCWVDRRSKESIRDTGKLFRIVEFQNFVNNDLLVELFDNPRKKVSPISHSTARSWLQRFGYYDMLRKNSRKHDSENSNCKPIQDCTSLKRRKRAHTWTTSDDHVLYPVHNHFDDSVNENFGYNTFGTEVNDIFEDSSPFEDSSTLANDCAVNWLL